MMNRYEINDDTFLRMGRFDPAGESCGLWWSGSGVRTLLDCTRLELEAECPEGEHTPWISVTVDGAPVARLPLKAGRHRYDLLGELERGFEHEVAILRDTQPVDGDGGPLTLIAVYTDGKPVSPKPRPCLVEFLGDSLTVGEGTVGPVNAQEWRMVWISNQFAFPTLVSELLNCEKRLVALGGWGAHRSWDGDTTHTIGRIYDRLCAVVSGGDVPYDFSSQRPADAVVINLGTNDASALDKLSPEERKAERQAIEDSAFALMEQVRRHNPKALILWAYGMCGDALKDSLQRAVDRRSAAGDSRVRYLALESCGSDVGSRSHPGRPSHQRAALQIAQAIRDEAKND